MSHGLRACRAAAGGPDNEGGTRTVLAIQLVRAIVHHEADVIGALVHLLHTLGEPSGACAPPHARRPARRTEQVTMRQRR